MAEPKDDITEERRILKEAGILDEKLLEKMDIFPGDRVRFRFYYPHSGFEEMIGHFLGFYTLYEGPEGGGDLNLVIRTVKDGRTTVVYKDRNYLEEYEILEPNMKVRDKIRDLDARHGRRLCDAGLPNVSGLRRFATSSFSRAEARASGCPIVFAPL